MSVASEDEHVSAVARLAPIVLLVGTLHLDLTPQARGEIVEEIVAWVDGDIVTKSDLEREVSDLIEAAHQSYSGEELRRRLEAARQTTLLNIIDHKVLHHRGQQIWGASVEEFLYRDFRQQNGLSDEEEFEQLLAQEGLTVERLKHLLSEKFVPDRVREHEVAASMPGIGDLEVRDYYDRHPNEFMAEAEVESRGEGRLIPFDESIDRARETLQNERYMERLEAFVEMARGEAEWWVKAEYRDCLPEGVKPTREAVPW
jgi:hypothetical protein